MSLVDYSLWTLCGLGSVAFASGPAPARSGFGALAAGFGAAVVLVGRGAAIDPVLVAVPAALLAGLQLWRPCLSLPLLIGAGGLAGIWSTFLQDAGMPVVPALALAAAPPALSTLLARRPQFAPAALREEALLGVLALALLVATAPTVASGWRAAVTLNLERPSPALDTLPGWVVAVGAASIALGGLYSLWGRR